MNSTIEMDTMQFDRTIQPAACDCPLVLASSSPRRRVLMAQAGYNFRAVDPTIPEPDECFNKLPPSQQAEALAYFKARVVAEDMPDATIIGADTIVALAGRVMGKPADEAEARQMLGSLSGTRHAVITGMTVLEPDGRRLIASDVTYVTMRTMTPEEIDEYIASDEWVGKAGAYAIQETADRYVTNIEGSFTNIVGLPMELLARMLKKMGHR